MEEKRCINWNGWWQVRPAAPHFAWGLAHVVRDSDGKIRRDVLPVVALRTTVYQVFTTSRKHKPIDTGTTEELKENGWVLDRHEVKTEAMVAGDVPAVIRLRRFLKLALRSYGLRCTRAVEVDAHGNPVGLPEPHKGEDMSDACSS